MAAVIPLADRLRPRLLEAPTEEMGRVALQQVRRENGWFQHAGIWLSVGILLLIANLIAEPGSLVAPIPMAAWGIFLGLHGLRAFGSRRQAYERRHRRLLEEHREEARSSLETEALRRRLLETTAKAQAALRADSPATVTTVTELEAEALSLVAWLEEAEEAAARFGVGSGRRRRVSEQLADPRASSSRPALELLLAALDERDSRLAMLEAEIEDRRSRIESFLIGLENLTLSPTNPELLAAVSGALRGGVAAPGGEGGELAAGAASRIVEEVRLAQDLQSSILPQRAPEMAGLRVAHRYRPSSEVGGDFYDFYALSDSRLLVALGDASGHGLASSMVSSMAKSALYLQVSPDLDLARAMSEMNRVLCDTLGSRRFMTLSLLDIDLGASSVAWSNAGQVYPLLVRDGTLRELQLPGYPLGVRPDREFAVQREALVAGDLLLLVTDGLLEAADADGEPLGWQRLSNVLAETGPDPESLLDRITTLLAEHLGDQPLQDDVTLIAVSFDR